MPDMPIALHADFASNRTNRTNCKDGIGKPCVQIAQIKPLYIGQPYLKKGYFEAPLNLQEPFSIASQNGFFTFIIQK